MIKYKLIGDNNYFGNLKEEYFKNRGIKDYKNFVNLNNHELTNPLNFENMDKAIEKFIDHMDFSTIGLIIDEDVDGITSSCELYSFISDNFENDIIYITHKKNKAHGIILEDFTKDELEKINLLIIADSGSYDYEQQKELFNEYNIDIIILDHHSPEEDSKYLKESIIVNNNICNISINLTGSAMAYMFIKAVSNELNINIKNKYLDLVMMGLVGDSADTSDLDVQYLIQQGLNNIQNEMIEELISKENYSLKGTINQESFGWYICPDINAVIRYGDYEQRRKMFEAFCGIGDNIFYDYTAKRGKNKGVTIQETLYEHVARYAVSLKGKQQREIKKIIDGNTKVIGIKEKIKVKDDTKVIVVDATKELEDGELTGLLANKIMSKYNLPTIVLRKNKDGLFSGSGRGELIENFKTKLNKLNLFEAKGHEPAFGVKKFSLNDLTISKLNDKINIYLKNETLEKLPIVDFVIPFEEFEDYIIEDLMETKDFWGQGMDAPKIFISGITVDTNNIHVVGQNSNTLTFASNFIKYVMFNLTEQQREELVPWEDELIYNLIGKPSINEHEGEKHLQIIIEKIELVSSSSEEEQDYDWSEDSFDTDEEW